MRFYLVASAAIIGGRFLDYVILASGEDIGNLSRMAEDDYGLMDGALFDSGSSAGAVTIPWFVATWDDIVSLKAYLKRQAA